VEFAGWRGSVRDEPSALDDVVLLFLLCWFNSLSQESLVTRNCLVGVEIIAKVAPNHQAMRTCGQYFNRY